MESGLGLEKQNLDSGRGRTFFLTSLLIELIESLDAVTRGLWPLKQMLHRMPPLSFPSFGEDSCSGGKSSSATFYDVSPFALLYKISEPACRLWFFLTGRSTRATSFLFFLPLCNARPNLISAAYCRARRRPSANRSATFRA